MVERNAAGGKYRLKRIFRAGDGEAKLRCATAKNVTAENTVYGGLPRLSDLTEGDAKTRDTACAGLERRA
ncbi:MAG: hypothetical protein ACTTKL_06120 [Treponema sp.]